MIAKYSDRRGSALIITMLMVTVIASVSFAVTALALSEFRKAANIQDSIVAYYAAESGLEHGLMEYRLWHDAEISKEIYDNLQTGADLVIPTDKDGTAQSFRLTGTTPGETLPNFVKNDDEAGKGKTWYDLKMFYRGDKVGEVDASGNPVVDAAKSPRVKRDSAAEYNVEGAKTFKFAWAPDPVTGSPATQPAPFPDPPGYRYFVQLTFTSTGETTCPDRVNRILGSKDANDPLQRQDSVDIGGCNFTSVRIKPWNMNYAQYGFTLLDSSGSRMPVDQLRTSLVSTGYSGGAKRTLQLNLSRTIGTIIESGDFLFLSGDKPLVF